jgi:hypothetical protein
MLYAGAGEAGAACRKVFPMPLPRFLCIGWLCLLAAVLACASPESAVAKTRAKVAYGLESDIKLAEQLWKALEAARVIGPGRINVHAYKGERPHGAIQQLDATTVEVGDHRGRVIVKANHTKDGATVPNVYDNPNKYLSSYTVMFTNRAGYDPDNRDWFWVRYWADGKITRTDDGTAVAGRIGKIAKIGCIGCHRKVGGEDLEAFTAR